MQGRFLKRPLDVTVASLGSVLASPFVLGPVSAMRASIASPVQLPQL
jgi:hypothetical protein